jgi:hypothetical protein
LVAVEDVPSPKSQINVVAPMDEFVNWNDVPPAHPLCCETVNDAVGFENTMMVSIKFEMTPD